MTPFFLRRGYSPVRYLMQMFNESEIVLMEKNQRALLGNEQWK